MSEAKAEGRREKRPDAETAARARAEAEARRARREAATDPADGPREVNGRPGPDPARYGDWENKGIASDFRGFSRGMW